MLVLACNPCPCGEYHPYNRDNQCRCSELKRREYRRKISGPIADRIDITRFVEPVKDHEADDPVEVPESSATVRARVTAARRRQLQRYADTPWRLNSHVPGPALRNLWPLDRRRPAAWTARCTAGCSPAEARRGCTGSRGRSPTCDASTGPRGRGAGDRVAAPQGHAARSGDAGPAVRPRERIGRAAGTGRPSAGRRAGRPPADRGGRRARAATVVWRLCVETPTATSASTSPSGCGGGPGQRPASRRPQARASGSWSPATRSGRTRCWTWLGAGPLHERGGVPAGAVGARPAASGGGRPSGRWRWSARGRRRPTAGEWPARSARLWPSGPDGGVRGGLRHRPGRPPRRPRDARADGRGAGVRGRPRLPGAHRQLLDYIADTGLVVSEARARRCAPTRHAVPGPQPADRRAARRHGRGGGSDPQRRAQHRVLGAAAQPRGDGGARSGHQRAVGGRAPADPGA